MNFFIATPWMLLIILLPAVFWFVRVGRKKVKTGRFSFSAGLKAILVLLLVLALADIRFYTASGAVNLIVALDVSSSCAANENKAVSGFLEKISKTKRKTDKTGLIVFGEKARVARALSQAFEAQVIRTVTGREKTDIENAVQTAAGQFKQNGDNRIVLLTDGNENTGDARRGADLARSLGVQIWPVPVSSWFKGDEVYIEKLSSPERINVHTPFSVRVVLNSTAATQGELILLKNDELMIKQNVKIEPGKTVFEFEDVIQKSGSRLYKAYINPEQDTIFENNEFVSFTTATDDSTVLYVSNDPKTPFSKALAVQGILVDSKRPARLPGTLNRLMAYRAVIVDNVPANAFSISDMENIQSYVRDAGGGFMMLGGDSSFGAGLYLNTPVEKVLPVGLDHPTTLENPEFCLILLIDTSSSMSGTIKGDSKLAGAKSAAFSVVELLNPFDKIGLLAFDTEYRWVVPVMEAGKREKIANELSLLTAIGGTNLYPALQHAFETLFAVNAQKKHVIILSDGKTKTADFETLVNLMTQQNITISTVALGKKSDRKLMEQIAKWGNGRSYYTTDTKKVPKIFTADTRMASQKIIIEEPQQVGVSQALPFMTGLPDRDYPLIDGMVMTWAKPSASVVLSSSRGPVLVAWQYGLGRSIAFTSAFDGKWGRQWVEWENFEKMASQMVKWVQKSDPGSVYGTQIDRTGSTAYFKVDVKNNAGRFVNLAQLKLKLAGPLNRNEILPLDQIAPGHYSTQFKAAAPGEYYLTLHEAGSNLNLPTQTFFMGIPYSDEYRTVKINQVLLKRLAEKTGGRVLHLNEPVDALFESNHTLHDRSKGLWPLFLLLFSIFFVLDIALHKRRELKSQGGMTGFTRP